MRHQIVKIGTKCLFDKNDKVDYPAISTKVREIIDYDSKHGTFTTLVVSGAVEFGRRKLNEQKSKDHKVMQRQAGAGQMSLMGIYESMFENYGKFIMPMLLTYNELENMPDDICRSVKENSRSGLYVIVNYNDATDFREVQYDNDTLAAEILTHCRSEQLIILGRYNGIMDREYAIPVINDTSDFMHCDNGDDPEYGRGGFLKKMEAGQTVIDAGKKMIVGHVESPLESLISGCCERTLFMPKYLNNEPE
ncbi:hypothetical protein GF345_04105 [Candidatus Woesearchaeota archaeon]|nr:hypothetical protein [Candidatus Woesearchaeota archaeon]